MQYSLIIIFLISTSALILAILAFTRKNGEKYTVTSDTTTKPNPCASTSTCGVNAKWAPNEVCKACCDPFYSTSVEACSWCQGENGPCSSTNTTSAPCCIPGKMSKGSSTPPTCQINITPKSCHKQGGTYKTSCRKYATGKSCDDGQGNCTALCEACCFPLGQSACTPPEKFHPAASGSAAAMPECVKWAVKNCHNATSWKQCQEFSEAAAKAAPACSGPAGGGSPNQTYQCGAESAPPPGHGGGGVYDCCVWGTR